MGEVVLYFGPAGCGRTRLVLERFAEALAAADPADLLWGSGFRFLFLTADADQARAVRSALLVDPNVTGLVGPTVLTFGGLYDLILRLAGRATPRVLSDVARLRLLRRVLEELSEGGGLSLLADSGRGEVPDGAETPMFARPGFVTALDGFIQELKQGAKEPADFSQALDSFGRDDRSRDLEAVYERYQHRLTEHGLYDGAGLSWYAGDLLGEAADGFSALELLVVDGFVTFTPTQMTILKRLAGCAQATLLTLTYEEDPDRSELYHHTARTYALVRDELGADPHPLPPAPDRLPTLTHIERNLFRWEGVKPSEPDPERIQVLEAPGDWREALEVAREIKRLVTSGYCRPADVLILCRSRERHGSLLARGCARLGVPLRAGPYRSLFQAPAVAVLVKALRVAVEDWPRPLVCDVLSSPYLTLAKQEGEGDVDVGALAARAFIVGRRGEWMSRLERLRERLAGEAREFDDVELPPERVGAVRRRYEQDAQECVAVFDRASALASALHVLPEEGSMGEFVAATTELVGRLGLCEGAMGQDEAQACRGLIALGRMEEVLAELAESLPPSDARMSRAEFVQELRLSLSEVLLEEGSGSSDAVRLMEVHEARGHDAPVVFVVGLVEGVFPTGVSTRPFYGEAERQRLNEFGLGLEQQQDIQCREMLLFYTAVSRATRRLYLTYPATDSRGKTQLRSHFVDEVEELLAGPETCRRSVRLSDWPPTLSRVAGDGELLECWAAGVAERPGQLSAELAAGAAALAERGRDRLQALCEGAAQLRQRERTDPLDAYDGVLTGERTKRLLAEEFGPGRLYSASQFDQYARCPFRFFLSYLVGLEPPQALPERLEPTDVGSLCHRALARVHRRCAAVGETVWDDPESTERLLDEELKRLFSEELRERLGLSRALADVYRSEVRELLTSVLRSHPEGEGFGDLVPRHFELAFGRAGNGDVDPASRDEPLVLELGGERVLVRGRIDRVDVSEGEPRRYGVLDYKLGQCARASALRQGKHTQLALYVAACEELFFPGATCEVAGFLSLSRAELIQPIRTTPPTRRTQWMPPGEARQHLRHYLSAYVRAMRRGLFPPAPVDDYTCSICPFAACCRHEPTRIERKLGPGGRDQLLGLEPPQGEEASG